MAETILLIDGMYLVFNSFYSHHNMRTMDGNHTGAVYGFISRVERLLKDVNPDIIAVAFDVREKTFRHEKYPEYKAKRQSPPEELIEQLPFVKEYLCARGIPALESPGLEADDIIAGVAKREAEKGNKVVIFTADKDLFQLVDERVNIYHPKVKEILDASGIKTHYGMEPNQIVDFLSLTGDASDNIPGIPGVGEKTAVKLLEEFQTVANLLENIHQVKGKLKTKIESNLDSLHLSRELVDLSDSPALEAAKTAFPLEHFKDETKPELLELYRKLSFNSLIKTTAGTTDAKVQEKEDTTLNISYTIIKELPQLLELKEKILKEKYFAYDLETTALEFYKAQLVGLSISFTDGGFYIPLMHPNAKDAGITITVEDFKRELTGVFQDPEIKKTGHNLKFDIIHLKNYGIDVRGVKDDSMIMSYLLSPSHGRHGLKDLTARLLDYHQVEYDQLVGKGKKQAPLFTVDLDKLSRYCIDDSYLTLKLIDIMGQNLKEKELYTLYDEVEMPLVKVLTDMEHHGVKVDTTFLKKTATELKEKINQIEQEIYKDAGVSFNLNSSQQLGELLFEKMNLPVKKKTRKTKSYSTDIDVLNELKDYPVVAKVIEYRGYKKLLSTYLEGLLDHVDQNNFIHSSFNQTVTATGRLSSSNPNLQNIPVGETAGINVRDAFVAEEGKNLLAADYSQVELRVMAHFSEDKNLMEAFQNDFDIHQHTADTVFGKDLFMTPQELRKRAKIINFSVLYGSGAFSLSKELGVGFKEAQEFIDMYFEKNIGVRQFIEKVISETEQTPEVKTILGRRREIREILSSNRNEKENGKRMAINTIIQGSAADIIKIAMINIHKKLQNMESKLIMQVHDELVFQYPQQEEQTLLKLVKEEMENALQLKVPLKVTLKKGQTWGTMKEI